MKDLYNQFQHKIVNEHANEQHIRAVVFYADQDNGTLFLDEKHITTKATPDQVFNAFAKGLLIVVLEQTAYRCCICTKDVDGSAKVSIYDGTANHEFKSNTPTAA